MIKLVAFDLDGTLGDTIPLCLAAFEKAVSPYTGGHLTEEEIIQTFGLNEEGMIKQIIPENWEEALDNFYNIYREMHPMCPSPFDGIRELLDELKTKGIPVVLITGKGKVSCDITLRQFEMENCFDFVATGSPVKNIKAELLTSFREKYNLAPEELVYVGDTVSDIKCCNEAGVRCLSAGWASSTDPEELEKHNSGNVFSTVDDLKEHLCGLFK